MVFDRMMEDNRIRFTAEPPGLAPSLRERTESADRRQQVWQDA